MSVELEASNLLRELVMPSTPGESVKALIGRAARRSGLTFGRVRKLWYLEARRILATEMDLLRAAAGRKQQERENEAKGAYRAISERLARIESALGTVAAHRDQPDVDLGG